MQTYMCTGMSYCCMLHCSSLYTTIGLELTITLSGRMSTSIFHCFWMVLTLSSISTPTVYTFNLDKVRCGKHKSSGDQQRQDTHSPLSLSFNEQCTRLASLYTSTIPVGKEINDRRGECVCLCEREKDCTEAYRCTSEFVPPILRICYLLENVWLFNTTERISTSYQHFGTLFQTGTPHCTWISRLFILKTREHKMIIRIRNFHLLVNTLNSNLGLCSG